jgi:hypothetical protein
MNKLRENDVRDCLLLFGAKPFVFQFAVQKKYNDKNIQNSLFLSLVLYGFVRDIQCVRKVAVHLQQMLEAMSTSVFTGLNPFNFIRKHFLQICVRKVDVHL